MGTSVSPCLVGAAAVAIAGVAYFIFQKKQGGGSAVEKDAGVGGRGLHSFTLELTST